MCFKRPSSLRGSGLGVLLLLMITGCSLRLGEDPKPSSDINFSVGDARCLSGGSKTLIAIADGKASEKQISDFWNCASNSLRTFMEETHGATPGVYQPDELRRFLKTYFVKETLISDRLLQQFMQLKCTLLGGGVNALTSEELDAAIQLLDIVRDQNLKLRTFFPLTAEHFARVDAGTLENAVAAIENAAVDVSKVLRGTGNDYRINDLNALLEELQAISTNEKVSEGIQTVRKYLPAFQQLKAALVSPDPDRITSREWETLLTTINNWYALYLRYAYARHQDQSWVHGVGRTGLVDVAKDFVTALSRAVARSPDQIIPFGVLERLIDSLDSSFLGFGDPTHVKEHLKAFLKPLTQRVLAGNRLGSDGRAAQGITQGGLQHAWGVLEEWSEGQRFVDLLFEKWNESARSTEGDAPIAPKRSELLSYSVSDVYGGTKINQEAADRIRRLIETHRPLYQGEEDEIEFAPQIWDDRDPIYSYSALTKMNYMNVLARMLVQSYAEEPARTSTGITLEELKTFYLHFRDLGVDLRVFDKNNANVYASRFTEANLFLDFSNGDDLLQLNETQQILAYMISAKASAKRTHLRLAAICNAGKTDVPMDDFGFQKIEAQCYRREFFASFEQTWDHMPLLRDYFRGLNAQDRGVFARNLESAARKEGYSDVALTSSDSEAIAGLAHYLESIFGRFDRDRSGTISRKETLKGADPAFRVFRKILEKASCTAGNCLHDSYSIETLFTFLLAQGHVPGPGEFVEWYLTGPLRDYEADRGRLIEIMAELSKTVRTLK